MQAAESLNGHVGENQRTTFIKQLKLGKVASSDAFIYVKFWISCSTFLFGLPLKTSESIWIANFLCTLCMV